MNLFFFLMIQYFSYILFNMINIYLWIKILLKNLRFFYKKVSLNVINKISELMSRNFTLYKLHFIN